jgi:hypothetical protein
MELLLTITSAERKRTLLMMVLKNVAVKTEEAEKIGENKKL